MTSQLHTGAGSVLPPAPTLESIPSSPSVWNVECTEKLSVQISWQSLAVVVPKTAVRVGVHLSGSDSVILSCPEPTEMEEALQLHPGNLCILAPGSSVMITIPRSNTVLWFELSLHTLRCIARDRGNMTQTIRHCLVCSDMAMLRLSRIAMELAIHPEERTSALSSTFAQTIYAHVACTYSLIQLTRRHTGGLSPSSKRLVDQELIHPFAGSATMSALAKQCGLSIGHFARAFRQTYGKPFYRCVLEKKVERAKELLHNRSMPLHVVAEQVGYSDQATFTESFSRVTGVSPGRYRRQATAGALDGSARSQSQRTVTNASRMA